MSEEKKAFNVKDRRMFTADGELRPADEEQARPAPTAATQEPASSWDARPAEVEPPFPGSGQMPVSLAGLLVSLASQGAQALSTEPPRLDEARTMIALLEMLRDKTEGRRTGEENEVLEGVLYQLRMAYLERQRVAGA